MHSLGFALALVLRTYDMTGVPPPEIANAAHTASVLLGRGQIEVSWVACHRAPAPRDRRCDEPPRPAELIVRLITAPPGSTNPALGDAYVDTAAASGWFATIYIDRVRNLAAVSGVDPGTLMGRAIAHEVGHLLLGTSHSTAGLMRAVWSASMLRRDGAWAWTFSKGESDRMRRKLSERLARAAAGPD